MSLPSLKKDYEQNIQVESEQNRKNRSSPEGEQTIHKNVNNEKKQ